MKKTRKKLPAPIAPKPLPKPVDSLLPFDVWWLLYSAQHQLSQDLKIPVRNHMKARGFWKTCDWDAGAKDFGF